jgi:hypothetical protein
MRNRLMTLAAGLPLLSCGCASQPVKVVCQVPLPPAPLMEPGPTVSYRERLQQILDSAYSTSPTTPTAKPSN